MKKELDSWPFHYGKVLTLYDRPPSHFQTMTSSDKIKFIQQFNFGITEKSKSTEFHETLNIKNLFVKDSEFIKDRPCFLVSSTSWTEDEDFSILLNALEKYNLEYTLELPKLLVLITGKGPLKKHYMAIIDKLQLKNVRIITGWFTAEEYPMILGCADIGISLHSSSSGVDLPMKVVDMFGSGIPVLALKFEWYFIIYLVFMSW
jgi:beta-1,4-mannosyltransferase